MLSVMSVILFLGVTYYLYAYQRKSKKTTMLRTQLLQNPLSKRKIHQKTKVEDMIRGMWKWARHFA